MTPDDLRDRVIQYYSREYSRTEEPLLLSTFGKMLRADGLWPIEGEKRSLASVIEDLAPDLVLSRAPDAKAFVVITPKGYEDIAVEAIRRRQDVDLLKRLPRAVLLAFCANTQNAVYLRPQPPFRYSVDEQSPDEGYLLVDAEFRVPGLFIDETRSLSTEHAQRLIVGLKSWADRHGIDLEHIANAKSLGSSPATARPKPAANALERLYQAQAPEWRDRLVVPVDIALTLSRLT